jgi:hypothetical protein
MMKFLLSSQNVFDYLLKHNICIDQEQDFSQIKPKIAKNFNLLLDLRDGRKLLVKQERHNQEGKMAGEFLNEWRIHQFFQKYTDISHIHPMLPEVIHFDANNLIIVFNYLNDYCDLADFYTNENIFPTAIATSIGASLATIHQSTFQRHDYQEFFDDAPIEQALNFSLGIERISPEVFGQVPADGLKFLALYQRYDSLGKAIAQLTTESVPCCLTHNDLKLNNILLHNNWQEVLTNTSVIRFIDWERGAWGDPAFDLGMLIASYLQLWLSSLVVSKLMDVEESLRLAITPLEQLQPTTAALTKAYLANFPEILDHRPDFLRRVVQFSGFAIIQQIQAMIQHQKSFGNIGICMLQVAKSLLCRPEQSIPTVFGVVESELSPLKLSLV